MQSMVRPDADNGLATVRANADSLTRTTKAPVIHAKPQGAVRIDLVALQHDPTRPPGRILVGQGRLAIHGIGFAGIV